MKAKMTEAQTLVGPGGQPREFAVGEIVEGKTARVAVANGWAEEIEGDAPDATAATGGDGRQFVGLTNAVAVPVERLDALEAAAAELETAKARISELEARAGEADDDQARATLEAAENEADRIVAEAKERAAAIVAEADEQAQATMNAALDQLKGKAGNGNGKK